MIFTSLLMLHVVSFPTLEVSSSERQRTTFYNKKSQAFNRLCIYSDLQKWGLHEADSFMSQLW